jgi:hypothetical protein
MANETAYPLFWPRGRKRTPSSQRQSDAPFSVGETFQKMQRVGNTPNGPVEVPVNRRRTKAVTMTIAIQRLQDQLDKLGADHIILSSNVLLRLDGLPRGGQRDPDDPGVACYFNLNKKRMVLASDKWTRVADNVAAIAAHIRSIRSVENYGVGTTEQAFEGYRSLEDFTAGIPWKRVLGFKDDEQPTLHEVEVKWKSRLKEIHPDVTGGIHTQAAQLNQAMTQARAELAA